MRLLVIGGSDAGISAAIRARQVAPQTEVTILLADRFPNYSICGLPFLVSGEVPDYRDLAHRKIGDLRKLRITFRLGHRAVRIDPAEKRVTALTAGGRSRVFDYDRLIIATGASSLRPDVPGLDLPGVFFLRWMGDAIALCDHLAAAEPRSVVIIGSGYIGMEMADAFSRRGLQVTVLARSAVLRTVDGGVGTRVLGELARNRVKVVGAAATAIEKARRGGLVVRTTADGSLLADIVLVATGSEPNSGLAGAAGASLGRRRAIRVNRAMETDLPDIYAAGDCVETWHRLHQKNVYLPLGTTAHKQGLVAGENAVGGTATFSGSLGTQVVKVFDLVAARTGLLHGEAVAAGLSPCTVEVESPDHKAYYPGATSLLVRLTAEQSTGALLGGQVLGRYSAEVSKRLDVIATAVSGGLTVAQFADLDLSYTPPTSSPWDPLQVCAQEWLRQQVERV